MHTVFALLCFVVVIHWLIFPYPSGLLHWHCGNLTIVPVPAKLPWWIWINTSCEFIMNNCITTTKQSTTKPCAYFLGYTVSTKILRYDTALFSSDQAALWMVQSVCLSVCPSVRLSVCLSHLFIRPFEKRTYYAMAMSVRPSVRLSVRPSVRVFRTFLQHALRYQFETWYIHSVGGTTYRVWVASQLGHFDLVYSQK